MPEAPTTGLLIGYGSIGSHHAGVLAGRYGSLVIVDASDDARAKAAEAHPDATVVADLDSGLAGADPAAVTAVIATWGPSHTTLLGELLDRGVRRVLVEKPLATSLEAGYGVVERARSQDAAVGCHLHMRYSGLVEGLLGLAEEHGLGPVESILVDGGARCLVTNGIHYLDLAAALFGRWPSSVISTASAEAINPRSPDLRLYGGTAVWDFGEGRELVMSLSNRSSLYERVRLLHRNAAIDVSIFLEAEVLARDPEQVERDASVTRSGAASERLFSGPVPGNEDVGVGTGRILDELDEGGEQVLSPEDGMRGVDAVVGALWAAEARRAVDLPLDRNSEPARREWPMS